MSFSFQARQTLVLAIPIMAGQVSQMLIGLVDSVMVGHVSTLSLAASAFALNVAMIPTVFGSGVMSGLAVRVAQAQGAGDDAKSAEFLRHGMWLSLGLGVLLSLLMLGLLPFLHIFGQAPEVVRESRMFFALLAISVAPVVVGMGVKSFGDAMQNPWPPTLLFLGSVPLTAIFNWVFIYGNLGAPAMGLTGAGIATVLARTLCTLALLWWLRREKRFVSVRPAKWRGRLSWVEFKALANVGVPAGTQGAVEIGAFAFGALLVGMLSADALAAHHVALTCAATAFMLPLGIGMATTVRVGNAVGARRLDEVRLIGFSAALVGTLVMMVTGLVFWMFGEPIARAFVAEDEQVVVQLAAQILIVAALLQLFDGLQITMGGALRGLSDATFPMAATFVAYWVLGLPLGWLLCFRMGVDARGIWVGFALGVGFIAVALALRFWKLTRADELEKRSREMLVGNVVAAH